jgi:hypothetical protein
LEIANLLEFAKQNAELMKYLPEDWNHTDKEWLQNILFTVDMDRFEKFIES